MSLQGETVFRLSKLTDYGIVVLAHLAREARADRLEPHNAREVAAAVALPAPVVSKVLKTLARRGVLASQRGAHGGYALERRPEDLTVAEMIAALEGPVAMTECAAAHELCELERSCAVRGPWQVINEVVQGALEGVTLADLIDPGFPATRSPLRLLQTAAAAHRRAEAGDAVAPDTY